LVFPRPQAEAVAGECLQPLKTLLETGARLRPETPEGQALAYQNIKETLLSLLEKKRVNREEPPGIYVYEVVCQRYRQTGIWALTALDDYRESRIKIHELTFEDSIRRMKNYRENTGLEGSPILLTYPRSIAVNRIIADVQATQPETTLGNSHGIHRLWKLGDPAVQQALTEAFAAIDVVYLADGHHRIESAALCRFPTISSLYMATDHLRIEAYDRVVVPGAPISNAAIFVHLQQFFFLREATANLPVQPRQPGNYGMYLHGYWYHMLAKDRKGLPDAAILQERVLAPFFGITDPKKDDRLKCAGGERALEEIGALFQAHPGAVAFTLCPLSVGELVSAADEGQILPPKSTWIIPKVPYGLLINSHLL
jgi:uncharacterized protein (DUF1015 family)